MGYSPVAPGTVGAMAGVALFLALSSQGVSLALYLAISAVVTLLGIWAARGCEALFGTQDDGRIVIDEVAGQLVTLTPILVFFEAGELRTGSASAWWGLVVTGFVVFRVLDIWKPGPVRWAERQFHGGLGVMLDDLLAGGIGGLLLAVPCYQVRGALS